MKIFQHCAAYYELLYKDKDYASEAGYVSSLIREHSNTLPKTILDVGCGTGIHAEFFASEGFIVDGIDASENMIALAVKREIPGSVFTVANAQNFDLGKTYDVVTSLFHVVSYQSDNNAINKFMQCISRHLLPGGLFIFDVWYGPAVLTDRPSTRVKELENEQVYVVRHAEPVLYPCENCVDVNYEIKITDKITNEVETVRETHKMRYYFTPELELLLGYNGLKIVHSEEWLRKRPPSFDTWGVCFVAQKFDPSQNNNGKQ